MLTIMLSATDDSDPIQLKFEHSLVSLSKWESMYEKPFFGREDKTPEETSSYFKFMLLNENPPEDFLDRLLPKQFEEIANYINSKQTATTFREQKQGRGSSEVITSELIYYWLVQFNIPFSPTEEWNLNRLMTLVKIAGVKQSKPKKMTRAEIAQQQRELNAERRNQLGTSG